MSDLTEDEQLWWGVVAADPEASDRFTVTRMASRHYAEVACSVTAPPIVITLPAADDPVVLVPLAIRRHNEPGWIFYHTGTPVPV